jgi:hypothetical protein
MPNATRAVVEIEKLRGYCLSLAHPRGRHKARIFASMVGLMAADAAVLRRALLDAALSDNAVPGHGDAFGQRYVIDFEMNGPRGIVMIRSAWIVRHDEDFPRFVTCFVR